MSSTAVVPTYQGAISSRIRTGGRSRRWVDDWLQRRYLDFWARRD